MSGPKRASRLFAPSSVIDAPSCSSSGAATSVMNSRSRSSCASTRVSPGRTDVSASTKRANSRQSERVAHANRGSTVSANVRSSSDGSVYEEKWRM